MIHALAASRTKGKDDESIFLQRVCVSVGQDDEQLRRGQAQQSTAGVAGAAITSPVVCVSVGLRLQLS